jgi:hypothetical protein
MCLTARSRTGRGFLHPQPGVSDIPTLADFIARGVADDPTQLAADVSAWRSGCDRVHFTLDTPS